MQTVADSIMERDGLRLDQDDLIEYISQKMAAPEVAPGTLWAYSNSGYVILGWIIERVRSRDLAELWHTGGTVGYRCRVSCFPEEGVSIILLINSDPGGNEDMSIPLGSLVHQALDSQLVPLPPWQALSLKATRAWTGDWRAGNCCKDPLTRFRI